MSEKNVTHTDITEVPPHISGFQTFRRVFLRRRVVIFGSLIILAFIITAIFAPVIAPYDPYEQDLDNVLLQPCREHLLGTDAVGRDTLSRVIYGGRTSLMVGMIAITSGTVLGMVMGLVAGYFGGIVYALIMRFIDAFMAIPMILMALTIAALLGGGLKNIMIALSIGLLPVYTRLMCGQVLSVKGTDYITAGHAIGASDLRIMLKHIVPNCFPPLIVLMTVMMGATILAEAGLSFLGIGIEPPGCAWGAMVNDGYKWLMMRPILSFAPGLAIMLVVFSFNMVGDGLRDALDPRLRGVI